MNKLIMFPLAIMLLLAIFSAVHAATVPTDETETAGYYDLELIDGKLYVVDNNVSPAEIYPTVSVMGDDGSDVYYFMTNDHEQHLYDPDEQYSNDPFSIWGMNAIFLTIGGIIILAGALGFSLFGSGFSDFTQEMALVSGVYFGLWGILSIFGAELIVVSAIGIFGSMLYFALTVIYAIGVVSTVNGDD